MRKLFLLIPVLAFALMANATTPTITIDGDKSDWAEVPMLSEPGTWPMLKVLPAADAAIGENALVFMLENNTAMDLWSKYPGTYIDKDYDLETNPVNSNWIYTGMGIDYSFTLGANPGSGWIDFPKGKSDDSKVAEIGVPSSYLTDLGSKFGIGMYYGTGGSQEWFLPKMSGNEISPSIGFLYKTRSFTAIPATITADHAFAHQSIKECTSYVDFGLRDNGYDTARWAAFPIELTQPAAYSVTANVTSTNSWKFEFWLVDVATNAVVAHIDAPESSRSESETSYTFGTLDLTSVPTGKYMLKVKNRTAYSKVKLNSLTLDYVGGAEQSIPGTTDVNEAWFSNKGSRADGMITFSSYTGQWVKWNVATASTRSYNVTLNINNPTEYGHRFTVAIYENGEEEPVASFTESSWNQAYGTPLAINMGSALLQSGKNYVVKVTNAESGAQPKIISVGFVSAGGGLVDIPGDITFDETLYSTYAWLDDTGTADSIRFARAGNEGEAADGEYSVAGSQYVKWRINAAKSGLYKFTANTYCKQGHNYRIMLLNADESTTVYTWQEVEGSGHDYHNQGSNWEVSTPVWNIPAGEYVLKVQARAYSRLLSIEASYEGGAQVAIPNANIPFEDAILHNATRDNDGIHFGMADRYAEWNVAATAGLYTFTFNVSNPSTTDYGKYQLTIIDSESNTIYDEFKGLTSSGSVTHSSIYLDGNYTLKVANTNDHSQGYLTSIAATAATDIFILDENTTDDGSIAAKDNVKWKLMLRRSFAAGKYYTLCIPIDSYDSELTNIFGTGYELWKMESATQNGEEVSLNFTQITGDAFSAGTPYLIKPTKDVENPTFSLHTIHNSTNNNVKSFDAADFVGSFYKTEIPAGESNLYLQNNNLYYSPTNATPMKGTRAWIRLKQQSGQQAPARARIVLQDKVATGIDLVQPVGNKAVKTIENGQLVIMKNGIRYNVMGTMIK